MFFYLYNFWIRLFNRINGLTAVPLKYTHLLANNPECFVSTLIKTLRTAIVPGKTSVDKDMTFVRMNSSMSPSINKGSSRQWYPRTCPFCSTARYLTGFRYNFVFVTRVARKFAEVEHPVKINKNNNISGNLKWRIKMFSSNRQKLQQELYIRRLKELPLQVWQPSTVMPMVQTSMRFSNLDP